MKQFTMQEGGFSASDYVAFGVLCLSSCLGGIWYSAIGSQRRNMMDIRDYLLGGKSMATFPVAMSLIASYVSGVTILGTPAEIYNYGIQYWLVIVGVTLSCVIVVVVYLPVFCVLKVSSSYEYLELRFNRHVRAVASILFLLDEVMFLPMVVYIPALAFNQLTGVNEYAVGGAMVLICGVYTSLGGLRAVVWTDSMQTAIMFVGVILVSAAGTISVGGINSVLKTAGDNGRLSFKNWSLSPYERQTGWGSMFGGMIYWTCFNSVNQTMVQRYVAIPTKRKAIAALAIFCSGAIVAITLCVWNGLAAWTAWVMTGCTPSGKPVVNDRLLPAFVTYVSRTQNLPGLSGVFLAGVFGAGLSSLSAVLNACSLVGIEDILHGWLRIRLKPLSEGLLARSIAATLAVISLLMLFVVSKLGGVLGVATALSAIAASTTCGIFTLGMVCWWVGPRGAIAGAIAGAIVAGTISIGTQTAAAHGLRARPMPFDKLCAQNATFVSFVSVVRDEDVFPLFRLSFHWIAPLGLLATLSVGAIVGWFFDAKDQRKLDAELYTPVVHCYLPEEAKLNAGKFRRLASRRENEINAARALMLNPLDVKTEHSEEPNGNVNMPKQ